MNRPYLHTWLIALAALLPSLALAPMKNAGIVQEHDLPSSLAPGDSYTTTWSLDIYNCEGFARFQVQLPEGVDAEPVETARASYSFEEGKAKFIWMELPPQRTLQISLKLTADESFNGGTVTQWFSFIRNGSRKDVEFEPHHLAKSSMPEATAINTTADLGVTRDWTPTSRGSGTMTVTITGHEAGQFLKLTETLGKHKALSVLEDGGCQIRDAFDGKLVCIWQAAPAGAITVKYTLRGGEPEKVTGTIATIRDAEALEFEVAALEESTVDQEPTVAVPDPAPQRQEPVKQEVAFRVQVLATHSAVQPQTVKRIYAFPGEIRQEHDAEWHKYTTGYHTNYRSARDNRVDLSTHHNFPGPFVTAYRNEKRITVQEALLLTKQNWIP